MEPAWVLVRGYAGPVERGRVTAVDTALEACWLSRMGEGFSGHLEQRLLVDVFEVRHVDDYRSGANPLRGKPESNSLVGLLPLPLLRVH